MPRMPFVGPTVATGESISLAGVLVPVNDRPRQVTTTRFSGRGLDRPERAQIRDACVRDAALKMILDWFAPTLPLPLGTRRAPRPLNVNRRQPDWMAFAASQAAAWIIAAHDRHKKKDRQCGGPSECRSGALIRLR
jgi:hypothetical protein